MRDRFAEEIAAHLAAVTGREAEAVRTQLSAPPNPALGDYAFPCFQLAKERQRPPAAVAAEVQAQLAVRLATAGERIRAVRAVGPYVNFFVHPETFMREALSAVAAEGAAYGTSREGADKVVCLDFSHPNIAKHLGVHHLRSTMIGHALRNIHAALGYRTVAINHLGDWGTQFGQLIVAYERWGENDPLESEAVEKLNRLYVRFHAEAEKDASLYDAAREAFRRLEAGDARARELWEKFRAVSLREFERIYRLLGVTFDSYLGEAHYAPKCRESIARLEARGLTKISEDALIVDLEPYGMPPALLLKRDESTLYLTRDLAAVEDRWNTYHFAKMLYVVDLGQSLHFQQLFKILELMGYEWAGRCQHVAFGLMRFKNAKMSTRKGQVLMLEDVLREGIERARAIMAAKNPDLPNADQVAHQVGIAAVVFADLKSKRIKEVVFDWEEALSFEGETGPYLQYTHARLCSILRKHGRPVATQVNFARLAEPEEMQLAKCVARFGAVLHAAAAECEPAILCSYLLDLGAAANHYYHQHRVLSDDAELTAARVLLVDAVRQTLANGLRILGLGAPEEM